MSRLNKRSPKWYGWLPDLPDHRDFSYSSIAPRLAKLPAKVDLRKKCSPIENQGEIGVCPENEWPYRVKDFTKKPTTKCYSDAKKHQITSYHRISTVDEMRTCLADGFPFVFGFTVYSAFESAAVAKSGVLNLPTKKEQVVGGHAVMGVGYDDAQKRFIIRN